MAGARNETSQLLLHTALELMGRRGFHGVTVREIARAARCSEMTVFRHFGSKLDILRAAMREKAYAPAFEELFARRVSYDLACDLTLVAHEYQRVLAKNRLALKVMFSAMPGLGQEMEEFLQDPLRLYASLVAYLGRMRELGRLRCRDERALAVSFLSMNVGFFFCRLFGEAVFEPVAMEDFVRVSVQALVEGAGVRANG